MSTVGTAYDPFANATLIVELADAPLITSAVSGWIVDPETGNLVPSSEQEGDTPSPIHAQTYKAHLHLVRSPEYSREAGADSTTFFLEGMLLSPWQFSNLVKPNQIFTATFNDLHGKFELLPEQNVLPPFRSTLGTRLSGIFRMTGAGQSP